MIRRLWTPEEDAVLRSSWPRWPRIRRAIPERSCGSIARRAQRLGLRSSRRAKRRWTPQEDALLADRWGEDAGKTLVKKLRRSETAIYLRAIELRLPRQDRGREHVVPLARRLGLAEQSLYRLLDECGLSVIPAALVLGEAPHRKRRYRTRVTDGEAAEACLCQRDARTASLLAWGRSVGVSGVTVLRWVRSAGLSPDYGSRKMVRYPVALLDEMQAGAGPWHAIWREILTIPAEERKAALWCLALAAHDLAHGDEEARAWVDCLTDRVRAQAKRIARVVMAKTTATKEAA